MSSPITFSGFNQIDFNMILNAVMQQERAPLTRLETQKKTLETQNSAFSTLAGKLATMKTALDGLKAADSMSLLKASSSDAGVGVSATRGSVTGTYDVSVSKLARAQVTAAQTTYGSLDAPVVTGGSMTLTLTPAGSGTAAEITAPDGTTLSQLAGLINANGDSPATASVVQTAPGEYRLVLTGKNTGSTNAFTIARGLPAGTAIAFPDGDNSGVSGDGDGENSQNAINAEFTVNGVAVTSASNTVRDVIPGATLSLLKLGAEATVKVAQDTTGAKELVEKFIAAYNDLVTFAKDQNTAAIAGKASIGRDPLLRGLRDALRNAAGDEYLGGTLKRLAEIGVGFDISGKMTLDEALFQSRLADRTADVQLLLSGPAGSGGAFGKMSSLVLDYTEAGGLISSTRERIDDTIRGLNRRMDAVQAQLDLRRASLQREYVAADLAMTRLKAQSSSLQSVGGQYRLF